MTSSAAKRARRDEVSPLEVDRLVLDVTPIQFQRALDPEMQRIMADFGGAALGEIGAGAAFNLIDSRVIGFLNEFAATRVVGITKTLRRSIQVELQKGVLAGEGAEAIARRVRLVFEQASRVRAVTIARTEVNAAANEARLQAFRQSGIIGSKKWNATLDSRTRTTHRELHGQTKPISQPFVVPSTQARAMRPGGFSDAGEDINCRCVLIPVLSKRGDDEVDLLSNAERNTVASFDRMTRRWEARFAAVVRGVYRKIETQILADLVKADMDL